jgi:hypothetical protein
LQSLGMGFALWFDDVCWLYLCACILMQKECPHGETCPFARNALEYWLHPDK